MGQEVRLLEVGWAEDDDEVPVDEEEDGDNVGEGEEFDDDLLVDYYVLVVSDMIRVNLTELVS